MTVTDPSLSALVLKIAEHYNTNIATRFIRPLLAGILAESDIARPIADMTEQAEANVSQGIHLDDLYEQILAMSRFVYRVRMDILPNIRAMSPRGPANDANRIYRDMAMNNFGANVQVLADTVYELYIKAVAFDKAKNPNGKTVMRTMPELAEIGRYLVAK